MSDYGLLNPRDAAIMALGTGLLAGGGPSRVPRSFGSILGEAGSGALQDYQRAARLKLEEDRAEQVMKMEQQRSKLLEQQAANLQAEVALNARRTAHMESPEVRGMLAGGDYAGVLSGLPGGIDPAHLATLAGRQMPDQTKDSGLARLLAEKAALPPGDPRHSVYDNAIRKESETAKQISPTVVMPSPISTIRVVEDDPKSKYFGKPVLKDGRTGKTLGLDSGLDVGAQSAAAGAKISGREMAQREADYPEATKQINIASENISALKSQLKELRNHKGLSGITGAVFGRTPSITEDSMAAQTIYDNIVNNVFVNALQSMRAASKTGGAVGNVSDKEGDRLEQTLAALSRAQGTKDFKNQVNIALNRLEIAEKNIKEAYEQTYSYRDQNPTQIYAGPERRQPLPTNPVVVDW